LFFETKSVIKTPLDFFLRGIVKDMFTRPLWSPSMNWSSELLLRSKQLHLKCWRTRGGKLNPARTPYVPRWSCLASCSIGSTGNKNLLSYTFIFRKQFYFVVPGLKFIGHGNPDNNLESPCIMVRFKFLTSVILKLCAYGKWYLDRYERRSEISPKRLQVPPKRR
jgi:hypothetical protein